MSPSTGPATERPAGVDPVGATGREPRPSPPVTVGGAVYERRPVRTHLIYVKEALEPVFERYVAPAAAPGDWAAVSEKFVTISQGRVIHRSTVRPGLLARLLVKGTKKYPDDVAFSDPAKMQVAIMQAGWFRMLVAGIVGAFGKFVLHRSGDFWRVAGHRVSEIDGFNPSTIKPFDEFAMIGPADPPRDAQALEDATGIPVAIVDANNINVEVLGASRGVPVDAATVREVLLDNPMGQHDELTPVVLVRRAG